MTVDSEVASNDTLFRPDSCISIYKVTRELKKEQNSLANCLNSIFHDTRFVEEISSLYPGVPVLANLRCGLWYTPSPDGTCYFKSTDGHNSNWSFSTTRLNWHVCELAANTGGCIIVDATRNAHKGGFPVSLRRMVSYRGSCQHATLRLGGN